MQESGAKRPAKLPQRESDEENDRADTLSDACQEGEADGDVPAHLSKMTKSAEAPEATQEAPLQSYPGRKLNFISISVIAITLSFAFAFFPSLAAFVAISTSLSQVVWQ